MSRLVSIPLAAYPQDALSGLSIGSFSIGAARAAMWLSQLAYEEDAAKVAIVLARWQLAPLVIFDRPGAGLLPAARTRGFVARGQGVTIVAFGGTDPLVLSNWVTDLRIGRTSEGAHRGFSDALDVMWGEISPLLPAPATLPVLYVGHSLGGAVALLAAWRALAQFGAQPAAVYGFGMPRPGNAALAARINAAFGQRIYRLAHGQDIVPSLPPAALGFMHAGRYLHCAGQGQFDYSMLSSGLSDAPANGGNLTAGWRERLLRLLPRARAGDAPAGINASPVANGFLPAPLGDHLPDRYWNALAGV